MTVLLAVAIALLCLCPAAADIPPLFDGGRSDWKAVFGPESSACVKYAAQEFTNAVFRVSGASIPVVASAQGVKHAIRFEADGEEWAREKIRYALDGDHLVFGGNQARAVLLSTYAFLHRELGCRWLWPGEDGAFYPAAGKWAFPKKFGYAYEPSVWFRGFHHCGAHRDVLAFIEWETRNGVNIHRHGSVPYDLCFGHCSMPSMHNANLNGEDRLFKEHPECFALLGGKRSMANVCFSSDRGAEIVAGRIAADIARRENGAPVDVISIFPNDTQDYCECPDCKAVGVSTGWFTYYNRIVRILKNRFPKLRFATIAYQGYRDPPRCRIENTEFIEYASHGRCHIHGWRDPKCARNVTDLNRLKAWLARGDVVVGHYAYEYDVLATHSIFLPFFSLVGEACETAAELGLVTQIPEVSLSPRAGPDARAWSVQNRLTQLYYTRKMWDAGLSLDEFLSDTCRYAFGAAAAPLKEYFLLMDGAWSRMSGDMSLFADGMIVATALLADEKLRLRATELLADAEKRAQGDERASRNVLREKTLFQQMLDYREQRLGNSRTFNIPQVEKGGRPPKGGAPLLKLEVAAGKPGRCVVTGCWTPKDTLTIGFARTKDAELKVVDADSERYVFSWRDGVQSQTRVSDVGIEMTSWTPAWTAEKKGSGVVFRIPLAAFRRLPGVNDTWEMRFSAEDEAYPFRDDMTVRTAFREARAVDRPVVFYASDPRSTYHMKSMSLSAEADGWSMICCTNRAELSASAAKASTYYFLVADRGCVTPETAAVIRENVRKGGTFVASSWNSVPLAEYFGDPSLKSHMEHAKDVPLTQRYATSVRGGDWCSKPWDIARSIRGSIAPYYLQVGDAPAGEWISFASFPSSSPGNPERTFVTAMKYGKGVIVLLGMSLHASHLRIVDNIRLAFDLQ